MKSLCAERVNLENIFLYQLESARKIDEQLEQKTKTKWQEIVLKAASNNSKIWDSSIYRLENISLENSKDEKKLILSCSKINFSTRLTMNAFTEELNTLTEEYFPMGMFFSVFIKTSDDYFVFGRKSKILHTNKNITFIGGVFSQSEYDLHQQNIAPMVQGEIQEELGVWFNSKEIDLIKVYRTENFNCCLLFFIESGFDKNYFENNFISKDGEISELIFVHKKDLKNFFETLDTKEKIKFEIINKYL